MKHKVNRSFGGNVFLGVILGLLALFMIIPMVFTVNNAFKPLDEFFLYPPRLFVRNATLGNFVDLFSILSGLWVPFSRYLYNSLAILGVATVGHILLASLAAYPLAKHKFPGRNFIFSLVVLSLMFAQEVTQIPNFLILSKLGFIDTMWSLIFPAIVFPLGLFLMKQFMEQIPDTLLEAARITGAGEWTIYWKIVMPIVKPAWLTLVLFNFQFIWGATAFGVQGSVFIFSEQIKPLPYVLLQIVQGGFGIQQVFALKGVEAAVQLFLLVIPVLVFIVTQRQVIETMTSSGLKE